MEKVNQYLRQIAKLQSDNPLGVVIAPSKQQAELVKSVENSFESLAYAEGDKLTFLTSLASLLQSKVPLVFVMLEDQPTQSLANYLRQLRAHTLTDFAFGDKELGVVKNEVTSIILWATPEQFASLPNEVFGAVCNLTYQD